MRKGSKIKLATLALAGLGVVMSSSAAMAEGMKTSSTGGLHAWSDENSSYWFKVGALIQLDQVVALHKNHHARADFPNSAHVRSARFVTQGGVGCDWSYYFGLDFGTVNSPEWANLFLQYNGNENSHIQVGLISQPISLSNWSSSAAITTMERPMVANAFAPKDGLGVYADYAMEMLTFAASVAQPHPDLLSSKKADSESPAVGSDRLSYAARVTFSPVHTPDYVWHFGVSGLHQDLHKNGSNPDYGFLIPLEMKGRNWPGNLQDQLVAVGVGAKNGAAKSWNSAGVELGGLWGPFSLQAEYMGASAKSRDTREAGPSNNYKGWYALAAYTLTGESKSYDFASGTFGKIKPASANGAWELFAQYSNLSLRDHGKGPVANVTSAGLNWYATPSMKVIAEYQLANYGRLKEVVGELLPLERKNVNVVGLRFQADFSA